MARWVYCGLALALGAGVLVGCDGTSSSSGSSEVAITHEDLETVSGGLCAVEGHATNVGNLTVNVTIRYEARSTMGDVIGTATASFQIAPFSDFDFSHEKLNNVGQPSSGTFTNGLACSGISNFKRVNVDVTHT